MVFQLMCALVGEQANGAKHFALVARAWFSKLGTLIASHFQRFENEMALREIWPVEAVSVCVKLRMRLWLFISLSE